ncbi:MAG: hypothetical protein ACREC9_12315 [Methylocella sp.]
MNDGCNSNGNSNQPKPFPSTGENADGASAPQQKGIANRCIENAKKLLRRSIIRPAAWTINWVNSHNGLLTAIATVAIAVWTYFVAQYAADQSKIIRKQLTIMQGQLDAVEADQRPWLKVDIGVKDFIFDANKDVYIDLSIKLKNIGKSPAQNIQESFILVPTDVNIILSSVNEQEKQCVCSEDC